MGMPIVLVIVMVLVSIEERAQGMGRRDALIEMRRLLLLFDIVDVSASEEKVQGLGAELCFI
jgi:hypothetical protein